MRIVHSDSSAMAESFFREYTSEAAVRKYSPGTAGRGISYLLEHDYKDIYLYALGLLPPGVMTEGLQILEFGCGVGMNLMHLTSILQQEGFPVARAVGTDFSPVLIETAKYEAKEYQRNGGPEKFYFQVARTENLTADISSALECNRSDLEGSFHFILGVNTIRYCHAAKKQLDAVREIFNLLVPGGVCVIIDMNDRFPMFRSDLKNLLRWKKEPQCYIPSLEEYAAPFSKTGFEVVRFEHFCWIPHSAGTVRLGVMRALRPFLNLVAKSRAMRSVVIAKKPAGGV